MELYSKLFGSNKNNKINIVFSPRTSGGGYSRKGIIVLSNIGEKEYKEGKEGYIRYFAHEIAHLWWSNAPTDSWEDWLNKSFAEYSAMIAMEYFYGRDNYLKRMNKKMESYSSLPPVKGIDRDSKDAYSVLYDKGCAVLYKTDLYTGRKVFINLMKSAFTNKIKQTKDLMELITKDNNSKTAEYLTKLLME